MYSILFWAAYKSVVSFAAVIRVVMQCSSPTKGCSLKLCIPFLKLTNKEQASISWKPGPLAANVGRNMIGAVTCSSEQLLVGEERYVTTLIMAAKETNSAPGSFMTICGSQRRLHVHLADPVELGWP